MRYPDCEVVGSSAAFVFGCGRTTVAAAALHKIANSWRFDTACSLLSQHDSVVLVLQNSIAIGTIMQLGLTVKNESRRNGIWLKNYLARFDWCIELTVNSAVAVMRWGQIALREEEKGTRRAGKCKRTLEWSIIPILWCFTSERTNLVNLFWYGWDKGYIIIFLK